MSNFSMTHNFFFKFRGKHTINCISNIIKSIIDNTKKFSNFDVYGHLDYVVRYGPKKDAGYTYELYQDIIDKILEKLISSGKGIEINTGGLSRGIKETNPCTDIVRRFKLMGGEIITIGSDAHTPDKIAAHFKIAESVLTECGFGYYCTFEGREPTYHRI